MTGALPLLVEIGTEELPPTSLTALERAFGQLIGEALLIEGFEHDGLQTFATPRRLAIVIHSIATTQPDQAIERRGPAVTAAYDQTGQPTKALAGFARSCGVPADTPFETITSDKGAWVVYRATTPGLTLAERLGPILEEALRQLPIARRMRWRDLSAEFVRPVRWLAVMIGAEVVPIELFGCTASNQSQGHRFMGQGGFEIRSPLEYASQLTEHFVMANRLERQKMIWTALTAKAESLGGVIPENDALLDEVTALVEWPTVLAGHFDERFLRVPSEVLISAMREHQRYFHLVDEAGQLLPVFLTVANVDSPKPEMVIKGNERVITPRLTDAEFFYDKDLKQPPAEWLESLKQVTYQAELGSYFEKAERLGSLSAQIAGRMGIDESSAQRAGQLAKTDLVSGMVGEFPDLQGVMGEYYARAAGEASTVSLAIREHYQPRFAGDALPTGEVSQAVALADRLDALVGLFGINQPPTGSKDPFALRRQAIGVVRICVESQLPISPFTLVDDAVAGFAREFDGQPVRDYLTDRFEQWAIDEGVPYDAVRAILARKDDAPLFASAYADMKTLADFKAEPTAEALISAQKRINNLLTKVTEDEVGYIEPALFEHPSEQAVVGLAATLNETKGLPLSNRLAELGQGLNAIQDYFDNVLVMSDDAALRANRVSTLKMLRDAVNQIADLSLLETAA